MTTSPRPQLLRTALVTVAVVALCGTFAGCSSDGSSSSAPASVSASASISVAADSVIIDVRTPTEYAAGHLAGAQNIDVENPNFDEQIAALDKNGNYIVYCRSGRRSAVAVDRLKTVGFTNVQDAGGLDEASQSTGIAIIK